MEYETLIRTSSIETLIHIATSNLKEELTNAYRKWNDLRRKDLWRYEEIFEKHANYAKLLILIKPKGLEVASEKYALKQIRNETFALAEQVQASAGDDSLM